MRLHCIIFKIRILFNKIFDIFDEQRQNYVRSYATEAETFGQPNEGFLYAGSPWRDKISLVILELQEKGVIQILYDKWWKNTGDVCNRDDKNKESKANALGVENIGMFIQSYFFINQNYGRKQ